MSGRENTGFFAMTQVHDRTRIDKPDEATKEAGSDNSLADVAQSDNLPEVPLSEALNIWLFAGCLPISSVVGA